jgi:spermidine synthase
MDDLFNILHFSIIRLLRNQMKTARFNIMVLGASSIIAQLLLFREIYSVVFSNELVFGILLSLWLMLSGIGTFIGRSLKHIQIVKSIKILHFLFAILPIISIFGIRFSRIFLFETGVMMDLMEVTLLSLAWLAPYCIASGIALVFYSTLINENGSPAKVYFFDLIGGGIGGIIFYFIFLQLFTSFDAVYLMLLINIHIPLLFNDGKKIKVIVWIAAILVIALSEGIIINYNDRSYQMLYPEQEVIATEDTPYGRLVITQTNEQYNFFEDGSLLFSTNSVMENEEQVHFSLSQVDNIKNVLLISGGIAGMTDEVLKYGPKKIDYTEINASILDHSDLSDADLSNPTINIFEIDGRKYIRNTKTDYDAILINLPSPMNAQLNRYYTIEFYHTAKKAMTKDAVLSIKLSSTANYLSPEQGLAQSVMYNTLKATFQNVMIMPGIYNYFIASDSDLTYDIIPGIIKMNIENEYVNQYYYDLISIESRADFIMSNLDPTAPINMDFKPFAYFSEINYLLSFFDDNDLIILIIFIVPLILFSIKGNPINFGLFAGGFAASSVQFIIILAFQVIYGYAYEFIALIFAFFMVGLAIGAKFSEKIRIDDKLLYRNLLLFIAAYIILLPLILNELVLINNDLITIVIFIALILTISILGGMQFPTAGRLLSEYYSTENISIASQSFSSDYFGASLGAILVSVVSIPLIGIGLTSYIIAAIVLTGYLLFMFKKIR